MAQNAYALSSLQSHLSYNILDFLFLYRQTRVDDSLPFDFCADLENLDIPEAARTRLVESLARICRAERYTVVLLHPESNDVTIIDYKRGSNDGAIQWTDSIIDARPTTSLVTCTCCPGQVDYDDLIPDRIFLKSILPCLEVKDGKLMVDQDIEGVNHEWLETLFTRLAVRECYLIPLRRIYPLPYPYDRLKRRSLGYVLLETAQGSTDKVTECFLSAQFLALLFECSDLNHRLDACIGRGEIHDSFTGLCNRRHLKNKLNHELGTVAYFSERSTNDLFGSLIYIDIDHLKKVSDEFGIGESDNLIKFVAEIIRKAIRPVDLACRWGGEEFYVWAPQLNAAGAEFMADEIRKLVNVTAFVHLEPRYKPDFRSVSCSVVTYPKDGLDLDTLMEKAEAAMKTAKDQGRNRVCVFADEMLPS